MNYLNISLNKNLFNKTKIEICKALIVSVLAYKSETVTLTNGYGSL